MTTSPHQDLDFEIGFLESLYKRQKSNATIIEMLANMYTRVGRIDEGLRMDRRHVRLEPENPTAHYNLACSLALKSRFSEAIKSLKTAVSFGFIDFKWMLEDPDLEELRETHAFELFINYELKPSKRQR
jgi:tetratricopeptide (TPR) repeat protein